MLTRLVGLHRHKNPSTTVAAAEVEVTVQTVALVVLVPSAAAVVAIVAALVNVIAAALGEVLSTVKVVSARVVRIRLKRNHRTQSEGDTLYTSAVSRLLSRVVSKKNALQVTVCY